MKQMLKAGIHFLPEYQTILSAVHMPTGSFQVDNGMKIFHLHVESGRSMTHQFLVILTTTGGMKKK